MEKPIVISLGGSLIVPKVIDNTYLNKFRKTIISLSDKNKFIIVCGGGNIARRYMDSLKEAGKNNSEISQAGVLATRTNAKIIMQLFGNELVNDEIPRSMKEVKNDLAKNRIVVCGALRKTIESTSDSTAAHLAAYFQTEFINMTNVDGLFNADPKKNNDAKLISKITWEKFFQIAERIKYKPGQHFVLDAKAAKTISNKKIKTFIIGRNLKNLKRLIKNEHFIGTTISND